MMVSVKKTCIVFFVVMLSFGVVMTCWKIKSTVDKANAASDAVTAVATTANEVIDGASLSKITDATAKKIEEITIEVPEGWELSRFKLVE